MALRLEIWEDGSLIGGVEDWWDDVEIALDAARSHYPILEAVSPYGDLVVAYNRLVDLADESRRLAGATTGRVRALMLSIADLCDRAFGATDADLRLYGD